MMLQVGKVGGMILDQRKAKSNIRDLRFKQGMDILTTEGRLSPRGIQYAYSCSGYTSPEERSFEAN
jgi:hypothetical protein